MIEINRFVLFVRTDRKRLPWCTCCPSIGTDIIGGGGGAVISTGNDDATRSIWMLASNNRLARNVFAETKQHNKSDEWEFTSKIQGKCNLRKILMHFSMFFLWSSVFSHMCSEHTSNITAGAPFT